MTLLVLALWAPTAGAAEPLRDHSHDLDVFQGPVLASSRVTSLGGAYTGLGDGVDGLFFNPAAVASRSPYATEVLDVDLDAGLVFPTVLGDLDFANDGVARRTDYDYAVTGTLGGALQIGYLGFGFEWSVLRYEVSEGGRTRDVTLAVRHLDVAYGFFGGQLVLGAGLRAADYSIVFYREESGTLVEDLVGTIFGPGGEAGVLVRPDGRRFRVGLSVRLPIRSERNPLLDPVARLEGGDPCQSSTVSSTRGLYVPCRVVVPWEVSLGASVRFGGPLNVAWEAPAPRGERATEAASYATPRRTLLVAASITATGRSPGALGLESFLRQEDHRSGRETSFTPALGVEGDAWPKRLRVRVGTYLEPARYDGASARLHGTAGLDVRLFTWDGFGLLSPFLLKTGGMIDVAREYVNFSLLSLGTWH